MTSQRSWRNKKWRGAAGPEAAAADLVLLERGHCAVDQGERPLGLGTLHCCGGRLPLGTCPKQGMGSFVVDPSTFGGSRVQGLALGTLHVVVWQVFSKLLLLHWTSTGVDV